MKYLPSCFLFLILIALLSACGGKAVPGNKDSTLTTQVEQLRQIVSTPANSDSLLRIWHRLDANMAIQKDTLLSVRVKYNIARLYGMADNDSAQLFIEQALAFADPMQGHLEDKAQVYTGMGNIWNHKAKEHQANYYYNKAATIVLSDTTLDLSPQARTAMLLSAAQSNGSLFQYDLAQQMNKAAMALDSRLPPGHINRQRSLVQTIQIMNALQAPADSIRVVLDRLEALHRQYPGSYDVGFLYECKNKYFERTGQQDSLLHYQLLKTTLDEEKYRRRPVDKVYINNLFVSYLNSAGTYIVMGKAAPAAERMQHAEALMTRIPDLIAIENLILYKKDKAALCELQGNHSKALALMYEASGLQKTSFQTENTQAVAEMNSLYQLQAKDRSIRSLNEDIRINQLQLQQSRLWLVISVMAAVLLGMGLLFLYYSYRQRRARQEKEKVLLQQQLLRTQMEPHFIFNTLSALQSFVRFDKKDQAIKYLNRFSRLLRSSLELSREQLVPLDEEIDTLENYLSLQQMRFEHAFGYRVHQPEEQDFAAVMLPPMLIQPYVENAILHGIDIGHGTGNIDIRFHIEEDILQVIIADSGKEQVVRSEVTHRSLSGEISRERMHLLGKKAGVTTVSKPGGGTTVTLLIPVTY